MGEVITSGVDIAKSVFQVQISRSFSPSGAGWHGMGYCRHDFERCRSWEEECVFCWPSRRGYYC